MIDQQRINLADVEYLDLDSVTKIIKNFQNPIASDLNNVNDSACSSREVATPARKTATELAAERTQLYRNTAENAAKSVGEKVTYKLKKEGVAYTVYRNTKWSRTIL